jgi:hypothetical protein
LLSGSLEDHSTISDWLKGKHAGEDHPLAHCFIHPLNVH